MKKSDWETNWTGQWGNKSWPECHLKILDYSFGNEHLLRFLDSMGDTEWMNLK